MLYEAEENVREFVHEASLYLLKLAFGERTLGLIKVYWRSIAIGGFYHDGMRAILTTGWNP